MKIAIIGAGLAGLTLARELVEQGHKVSLFDKGRGPGGRLSTRRVDHAGQSLRFDHGASIIRARDTDFDQAMAHWQELGCIERWKGPHFYAPASDLPETEDEAILYTGLPAMNALLKQAMSGLQVFWGTRLVQFSGEPGAWVLTFEADQKPVEPISAFEVLILAVPMEQARELCPAELAAQLGVSWPEHVSWPIWSLMLAYEGLMGPSWSSRRFGTGDIHWISHENSKPGRKGITRFVVHASTDFSQAHLSSGPEQIVSLLYEPVSQLVRAPAASYVRAHRWRYARPSMPLSVGSFWDPELGFGMCGDWLCPGDGIDSAWKSGKHLSEKIK